MCRKYSGTALFAVFYMVGLVGCGSGSFIDPGQVVVVPYTQEESRMIEEAKSASYRLRPGDQFSIIFSYEPDLNQRGVLVLPDGRATIVDAGVVHAAGKTIDEFDMDLTKRLSRVYEHPDLSIVMEELGSAQVYVLGEVTKPGMVELQPGGMGVVQALSQAGGFTDDAAKSETVIVRLTEQGYQYRRIDLGHIEKGGLTAVAMLDLQPYDIVYVPRSALGDLEYFNRTILSSVLNVSRLYWDFYALINLDKVDRILR